MPSVVSRLSIISTYFNYCTIVWIYDNIHVTIHVMHFFEGVQYWRERHHFSRQLSHSLWLVARLIQFVRTWEKPTATECCFAAHHLWMVNPQGFAQPMLWNGRSTTQQRKFHQIPCACLRTYVRSCRAWMPMAIRTGASGLWYLLVRMFWTPEKAHIISCVLRSVP